MCLVVLFFSPAADFGGMCFMERWPRTAVVAAFGVGSCNFGGDGGHLAIFRIHFRTAPADDESIKFNPPVWIKSYMDIIISNENNFV